MKKVQKRQSEGAMQGILEISISTYKSGSATVAVYM
jgi:hypothetical protein